MELVKEVNMMYVYQATYRYKDKLGVFQHENTIIARASLKAVLDEARKITELNGWELVDLLLIRIKS